MKTILLFSVIAMCFGCAVEVIEPMQEKPQEGFIPAKVEEPSFYIPVKPGPPDKDPCREEERVVVMGRVIWVPTWCDPVPYIYKGDPSPEK